MKVLNVPPLAMPDTLRMAITEMPPRIKTGHIERDALTGNITDTLQTETDL